MSEAITAKFGPDTSYLLPTMEQTAKLSWCDFLDDEDPILAAMAREIQNTPARTRTLEKYYYRYKNHFFAGIEV